MAGRLSSINPATGELFREFDEMTPGEARAAIDLAHEAFVSWRQTPFSLRAGLMRAAGDLLRKRKNALAALMASEMGKPVSAGRAEADKCAWVCDYYAENAAGFLAAEDVKTDATRSFVRFEPLGVVLAVMPWNFPLWQVFRFAAPALMAGNAGVLKHASNVCGCALAIEEVFRDAGFPEGLFKTLLVGSRGVGALIEHPRVVAVTLTGSTPAGRDVAQKAGALLKKTVLELGGSDPYVVLSDADVPAAAAACVSGRLVNSGQSCIAAKRFIVVPEVWGGFTEALVAGMKAAVMGDPMREDVTVGPLARFDLRDDLHAQVARSIEAGAKCTLGGKIPDGPGAFYPPTVLVAVKPGMAAFDEEVFGPVAAIVPARDEDEAIALANRSPFGLGAAVFTKDAARGEKIAAERIEAGSCFVNTFVKSDPRLPFGGIKQSGYGRELSAFGIREFVNIKTVYVK